MEAKKVIHLQKAINSSHQEEMSLKTSFLQNKTSKFNYKTKNNFKKHNKDQHIHKSLIALIKYSIKTKTSKN